MIRRVQERYAERRALLLHLPQERREPAPARPLPRGVASSRSATTRSRTWRPTSGASCASAGVERIDTVIDLELFSRISSLLSLLSGATHAGRLPQLSRRGPLPRRASDAPGALQSLPPHVAELHGAGRGAGARPDEIPTPKRVIPRAVAAGAGRARSRGLRLRAGRSSQRCYPLTRAAQHRGREPRRRQPAADPHLAAGALRRADRSACSADDPPSLVVLMGIAEAAESARDDHGARRRSALHRLRRPHPHPHRRASQLFHQSDLLITNDSGPAHFATLTPHQEHHPLRTGDAGALRHARGAQRRSLRQARLQPVPERAQSPPQPVHRQQVPAGDQRRRGARTRPSACLAMPVDARHGRRRRSRPEPR